MGKNISVKRVYDPVERTDGFRVLVDRLWPRGLLKEDAAVDLWAKDIAPSTELRKAFRHDPERWDEFKRRYRAELEASPDRLRSLLVQSGNQRVTLLFAAKDLRHNQAIVLREILEEMRLTDHDSGD